MTINPLWLQASGRHLNLSRTLSQICLKKSYIDHCNICKFEPIHILLWALSRFFRIQNSTVGPVWLHLALCTKLRLNHSISCLRERLFKVWISSPASTVSSCMCYSYRAVGAGAGGEHGPHRLVIPILNGG